MPHASFHEHFEMISDSMILWSNQNEAICKLQTGLITHVNYQNEVKIAFTV
jgi:hypothetical protein